MLEQEAKWIVITSKRRTRAPAANGATGTVSDLEALCYSKIMNHNEIAGEVSTAIIAGKVPTNSPSVLVLVGLQYSGKSYLASLIGKNNYAHFWATSIKKRYKIKNPDMIEVAKLVIGSVTRQNFNIVIDFVNHKYETRKQFQELADLLGVKYKVVYIDTPKEVRLKRRDENMLMGDQPGRRVISLEQMEDFERDFELPREDENVTVLQSQEDIDQFLKSI